MKKQLRFRQPAPDPCVLTVSSAVQGTTTNTPEIASPSQREGGEDSLHLAQREPSQDHKASMKKQDRFSKLIAFLRFSIHRDSMGQQHRVRIKRKRRRAYLQRKKASQRAATTAARYRPKATHKKNPQRGVIIHDHFASALMLSSGESAEAVRTP